MKALDSGGEEEEEACKSIIVSSRITQTRQDGAIMTDKYSYKMAHALSAPVLPQLRLLSTRLQRSARRSAPRLRRPRQRCLAETGRCCGAAWGEG